MAKTMTLDLSRKYESEYVTPKEPVFVVVGPAQYLSISGHGAPGGEHFKAPYFCAPFGRFYTQNGREVCRS
jgi:hypothetical protein